MACTRTHAVVVQVGRGSHQALSLVLRAGPAVRIGIASAVAMTVTMCSYWAQSPGRAAASAQLPPELTLQQTTPKSDRLDAYAREERAAGTLIEPAKSEMSASLALPLNDRINAGVQVGPNGERTYGIRIAVPIGTPVRAAADGMVESAGNSQDGYGNKLVIKHGAIRTIYGHVSDILVAPNTKVRRGQVIARSGQSGFATSPRLYLGVLGADPGTDPLTYFSKAGTIDRCAAAGIPCLAEARKPAAKPAVVAPLKEARPVPPSDIPNIKPSPRAAKL